MEWFNIVAVKNVKFFIISLTYILKSNGPSTLPGTRTCASFDSLKYMIS